MYFCSHICQLNIFLYDIFIFLYTTAIRVASICNSKARLWLKGRKIFPAIPPGAPTIWMHCSSLGEFEQGRPVLEALKFQYPSHRLVLTFFSPSGYEIRKNFSGVDHVFYLPVDTQANAKKLLQNFKPSLVVWVKYEYWFHMIREINEQQIPLLLIAARFRASQPFFKPWGSFWKKLLRRFNHIFVQQQESVDLLKTIGLHDNVSIAGDPRFDRVLALHDSYEKVEGIHEFIGESACLVAGSTWEKDELHLQALRRQMSALKMIIAPHEIDRSHLQKLTALFEDSMLYSAWSNSAKRKECNILIIDNIGMLSKLYAYATVTYIGGGFNSSGIHNTLEAAVYGKPVVFGPVYQKFEEAKMLLACGGGFSFYQSEELMGIIKKLLSSSTLLNSSGIASANMVQKHAGATKIIMNYVVGNRLLTS